MDDEASGMAAEVINSCDRLLGRVANLQRILITAMFNMIDCLNDSFRTDLEPDEVNRRQKRAVGITVADVDDYARRIGSAEVRASDRGGGAGAPVAPLADDPDGDAGEPDDVGQHPRKDEQQAAGDE
ncbi:MAG: hypothetical protein OEN48_16125 [Betaproteobacteria bacterium]|nr:hypothetical protein [Betaproteobacteria bacterium]